MTVIYVLTFVRDWNSRIREQKGRFLVRALFLACRIVFSHGVTE